MSVATEHIPLESFEGLHRRTTVSEDPFQPGAGIEPTDNLMYSSEKDPSNFPDGGTEAYIVVLGSFVGLIADFGIPNCLGALQSYVSTHQLKDVKVTTLSWIFSVFLGVTFFGGVFVGGVFDKYGARIPLVVGTVFMTVGLVLTAECNSVYQFILAFGVLTALGISIATQPLISAISHWFLRKRGTACSIATTGGLVGSSIFAVMLQNLYNSIGFKWAIRILALICLACMLISIYLVRGRPEMGKGAARAAPVSPEAAAAAAAAERSGQSSSQSVASSSASQQAQTTVLSQISSFLGTCIDFSVIKDVKFVLMTVAVAISELSNICTCTYLSSYALQKGVNERAAYLLITVVGVCGIPARLTAGWIADRYGRFNVMIGTNTVLTASIFCLWLPAGGNLSVLYAFGVVFGIANAALISLVPACCGQICSVENFGKVYGTLYFFLTFTTVLGMYCCSLVIGTSSGAANYTNVIYYVGGLSVVSVFAWIFARHSVIGLRWGRF